MLQKINYTLKKNKRSRRVSITINRLAEVIVTVPHKISPLYAEKFVQEKADWIRAAQDKMHEKYKGKFFLKQSKSDFEKNKKEALMLIQQRVDHFNAFYNFTINDIRVKNHSSRWGSCSHKGNLNFNYTLLKLPLELLDYVVVHELAHLKEMNHSRKFWDVVAQTIPDYKERRKKLKTNYVSR